MYGQVTRSQFAIKEGTVIHKPTGAEFTPNGLNDEFVTVWTGDIARPLPSGEVYLLAEVLAVMKMVWRDVLLSRSHLELANA